MLRLFVSTPVTNSDNDGILDAWKAGPAAGDFHAGQPGYYDVKTGSWVPLPGAKHGEKDLFVQLDYMCGTVNPDGSCASGPGRESVPLARRQWQRSAGDGPAGLRRDWSAHSIFRSETPCPKTPARIHHRAATMPVPQPAGSDRLEEQPGILEAVAAQSCLLRDGWRLHPSFPVRTEGQLSLRSVRPLSGDTGLEHALRNLDVDHRWLAA